MSEQIQNPINAFPEYVQQIICHYSETKGYPIEYFIQAFLGATSASLGRSVTLQAGAYSTIGSIWCIILGKRGFVKSEVLEDAFEPIRKWEHKIKERHQAELDELAELKANNPKVKIQSIPDPQQYLVDDSTPEKLVMNLAYNQKGMAIVYDEIAGFVGRFNRYANGGDEQMFLTLFNGSSIKRDRMNGNSAYAKRTFLTIIGTTQPGILKEVFSGKVESGFFDRWLITQPDDFKKQYPNQYGINPIEKAKYEAIITALLRIEYDENNFNQLSYTPESYKIVNDYQCWLVDEQNETEDDNYRGLLAKMEIYLHKFSLLLQAVEYALTEDILDFQKVSINSANGAVILTKYFIDQAKKVRIVNPIELLKDKWVDVFWKLPPHGEKFDCKGFVKIAKVFGFSEKAADNFLKQHGLRSETSLFYKVQHGIYTKNLF